MNELFVYGSLLSGCEPSAVSPLCARLARLGAATVAGTLFDLGRYPGAVLGDGGGQISGELVTVPDAETWAALDAYERLPSPTDPPDLFIRVPAVATTPLGHRVVCWVYVYANEPEASALIASGCWRSHLAKRAEAAPVATP